MLQLRYLKQGRDNKKTIIVFMFTVVFNLLIFSSVSADDKTQTTSITFASLKWAPFCYNDKQGNVKGLYIDLLKEIFETELGVKLEYKILPWKRAQLEVRNGSADFLVTVVTKERLEYTIRSELPILQLYLYVYTYKNHPKLDAINTISNGMDIKELGLIPVTNSGNNWHKVNIDNFGVKTEYVPNEESAFKFLALQRADITIEPLFAGSHLINQLGLSHKIVQTRAKFGPIIFHILLSKKSPYSKKTNQINQAIEKVRASGRYQKILSQYETIE